MSDPRIHVNEEPRNDFMDVALGFGGFFIVLMGIFTIGVVIKLLVG
ncbi:YqzM family protein [Paenibacillus sp. FJAT-26967]|nr:YqzM family protein [Paenibacillus sp. FJAT-26967]